MFRKTLIDLGIFKPNVHDIMDSIIRQELSEDELNDLEYIRWIDSSKLVADRFKVSFGFDINNVLDIRCYDGDQGNYYNQQNCVFIAKNLNDIILAIQDAKHDITRLAKERRSEAEKYNKEIQEKKDQETKCKTKLWTKFNQ